MPESEGTALSAGKGPRVAHMAKEVAVACAVLARILLMEQTGPSQSHCLVQPRAQRTAHMVAQVGIATGSHRRKVELAGGEMISSTVLLVRSLLDLWWACALLGLLKGQRRTIAVNSDPQGAGAASHAFYEPHLDKCPLSLPEHIFDMVARCHISSASSYN